MSAAVPLGEMERSRTYGRDVVGCAGVLADTRERTLVGAYAVGPLATEWIHMAVLAVHARVPVESLRNDCPVSHVFRGVRDGGA